jgi:hypothetical protein
MVTDNAREVQLSSIPIHSASVEDRLLRRQISGRVEDTVWKSLRKVREDVGYVAHRVRITKSIFED